MPSLARKGRVSSRASRRQRQALAPCEAQTRSGGGWRCATDADRGGV